MNEQLIVKNFGPIKDATVDFKKVTVFIGPTGGGKSTLAKLAAIFRDVEFYAKDSEYKFDIFDKYAINNYFQSSTQFTWCDDDKKFNTDKNLNFSVSLESLNKRLDEVYSDSNYSKLELKLADILFQHLSAEENRKDYKKYGSLPDRLFELHPKASLKALEIVGRFSIAYRQSNPVYIPSDRAFSAAIDDSLAGLVRDDIGLPKLLLNFINKYSMARREIINFDIPFLSAEYIHKDNKDFIKLNQRGKLLPIYQAASGTQAIIPLMITLEYLSRRKGRSQNFIIEEPELNLYPTAQNGLIKWLIEKCTAGENDLTITTHSPYILASCNLLMEAYKVWQDRPELEAEIEKIVPRASWINPDEFAAYYVADGTVRSIQDERTDLIGGNELDAVSGDISDAFRSLLRLKKQPA